MAKSLLLSFLATDRTDSKEWWTAVTRDRQVTIARKRSKSRKMQMSRKIRPVTYKHLINVCKQISETVLYVFKELWFSIYLLQEWSMINDLWVLSKMLLSVFCLSRSGREIYFFTLLFFYFYAFFFYHVHISPLKNHDRRERFFSFCNLAWILCFLQHSYILLYRNLET